MCKPSLNVLPFCRKKNFSLYLCGMTYNQQRTINFNFDIKMRLMITGLTCLSLISICTFSLSQDGISALMLSCVQENFEIVDLLLKYNADPNQQQPVRVVCKLVYSHLT